MLVSSFSKQGPFPELVDRLLIEQPHSSTEKAHFQVDSLIPIKPSISEQSLASSLFSAVMDSHLQARKRPKTSNTAPIPTKLRPSTPVAKASSIFPPPRSSAPQLQNLGSSRFLDLPLEVRRLICTYTLTFSPVIGEFGLEGRCVCVPRSECYTALLLVCRQLYWEACLLPFQINWFRIGIGIWPDQLNTSSLLFSTLRSWQAKELRNVELIVPERLLRLPFYLGLFISLLGCKYLKIMIEGKLSRHANMDMLSKLYGFQSIAPNLEYLRIAFEENEVCGESLKHLEEDLKALLPKVQIVILRERVWLNERTRH